MRRNQQCWNKFLMANNKQQTTQNWFSISDKLLLLFSVILYFFRRNEIIHMEYVTLNYPRIITI